MTAPIFRRFCAAALCTLAAGAAQAQTAAVAAAPAGQRCVVLPDTFRGATPRQVAERGELRAKLNTVARAHGVAQPTGLLFVDVDSTRRGKVIFVDTNLPDSAVQAGTRAVAQYLTTLAPGRSYQALIRVDGEYPAMAPGKEQCIAMLINDDERAQMMRNVMDNHPESGKMPEPVTRRAVMRMVVDRDGKVAYVDLEQPTGDAFLDPLVPEIAKRLRFHPARLNGVPYDVRFRYTMTFILR
ncbi:MAG TPA: TonB family protein [Longimicrobium sp.]|nr:TonB family protein [Longimicrobium sp.]